MWPSRARVVRLVWVVGVATALHPLNLKWHEIFWSGNQTHIERQEMSTDYINSAVVFIELVFITEFYINFLVVTTSEIFLAFVNVSSQPKVSQAKKNSLFRASVRRTDLYWIHSTKKTKKTHQTNRISRLNSSQIIIAISFKLHGLRKPTHKKELLFHLFNS